MRRCLLDGCGGSYGEPDAYRPLGPRKKSACEA